MRKTIWLVFLLVILRSAAIAQSDPAPSPATKSIQEAQTPAESGQPRKLDPAPVVETLFQPRAPRELKLAAGTQLDIEAAYTVSSIDLKPGDLLTFRVLVPIVVDGVTVIDKGSLVTARVAEARRAGHWGKAGRLTWTMQDVVAGDLTRVALQGQNDLPGGRNGVKGTSHGGEVATKTIVLGALMAPVFPIAPLALMSGFKRGEDAVLPAGKRFVVFVQKETILKLPADR